MQKITRITNLLPDKKCSACGIIKPAVDFYKLKNGKLYCWCKKCSRKYQKADYQINSKRIHGYTTKWARKNKNNGRCIFCNEPLLTGNKNFCEKHYLINLISGRLGLRSIVVIEELKRKLFLNPFCPYTGKKIILGENASIDHIKPISKFPELRSDINNVEWIDRQVNYAKRDMAKEEFILLCKHITNHCGDKDVHISKIA